MNHPDRHGPRLVLPRATSRLLLGTSGLSVSPICLGIVGSPDVVSAAFDRGVNFFFVTTDMHWPLYESLREGLRRLLARGGGIRDRIVVAAVTYCTQREFLYAPFQELIDEIPGLERVDVVVGGGAYAPEIRDRVQRLDHNRRAPAIGAAAVGASFHDRAAAAELIGDDALDLAFIRYSAAHPRASEELFPRIRDRSRALVFNFKTMLGWLTPEQVALLSLEDEQWRPAPTDHYRYVLSRPELDGVLCGLDSVDEVDALIAALDEPPLSDDEQQYLVNLYRLFRARTVTTPGTSGS